MKCPVLIVLLFEFSRGYRDFQTQIPNGNQIPHPCRPNFLWQGVGHRNIAGSGPRNPFGQDFSRLGNTWGPEICRLDSDGDGKTNGEELGDPQCSWQVGDLPAVTNGLSHPGVCEPMDSLTCMGKQQDWMDCSEGKFDREAVNKPGVRNITLRYPETKVPNKATNYYCMRFDLPSDQTYHLIATEPVIDTKEIMHHIVMSGCDDDLPADTEAHACNSVDNSRCTQALGVWTLGMAGDILHENVGIKIGQGGFRKVTLQFHWNNPGLRSDFEDSSGLTLYYTPNLRQHNAGMMTVGQLYLEIPPKQEHVEFGATCSAECSRKKLSGPVYVISALNHMHYLGKSEYIELLRNGERLQYLTNEEHYSYDSPQTVRYDDPVEIQPGDELRTTCVFQSRNKGETTFAGLGTNEEMCFGLITYYPAENMDVKLCLSWKDIGSCRFVDDYVDGKGIDGCRFRAIYNETDEEWADIHDRLTKNCNLHGSCRAECPLVLETLKTHPCFQENSVGELAAITLAGTERGLRISAALHSCPEKREQMCETNGCSRKDTMAKLTMGALIVFLLSVLHD